METIQIGDNTTPTAVERTPPEVWQMILLIAVESPLRPQSGDDVLDGNIVFAICCRSSKQFERTEVLRTQLRLVCHEWHAILKDVGHHLATFDHGYLQRAQFWGEETRKIRRIAAIRKCPNHNDHVYDINHASVIPLENTQWVESLLVSNECRTDIEYQFIMKVLDNAPRLRALQIRESGIRRRYYTNILSHQALTQITHLSIRIGDIDHEERLCFPAVQYLCLTLVDRRANESLPGWQFPSMRSFHLYRYDWQPEEERDLFEGLDHFVAVHGKKITSLFIEWKDMESSRGSRLSHSKEDFWRWFPNLRLLGPKMRAIRSLSPPPADSKLTSLAIPGLQTWEHNGSSNFPFDIYIDELLEACKILRVTRLIMTDSWEDMITDPTYMAGETLCWSKQLFEEAAANGIQVFNSDRIPITDRKGELFLQSLRDPIPAGSVGAASPRLRKSFMRRFVDKFSLLTPKK